MLNRGSSGFQRTVALMSVAAIALMMCAAPTASASPVTPAGSTATVHGSITDRATGSGVSGVSVVAYLDEGAGTYTRSADAVTDVAGGYALTGLAAGLYFYRVGDKMPDHSGGYVGWGDGDATASRFYLADAADEWGYDYQMAGADVTAPRTQATAPSGWASGPVTVTLSASDEDSGVDHITSQVGGVPPVDGPNMVAIRVAEQGTTTIRFHAVDHWGNAEVEQSVDVRIDLEAPVVSAAVESFYTAAPEITISAVDLGSGAAGVSYRLDGADEVFTEGASVTLIVGTTGDHVLESWAVDAVGNVSKRGSNTFNVASSAETGLPPSAPSAPSAPNPPLAGPPAAGPVPVVSPAASPSMVAPAPGAASLRRAAARRAALRRAAARRATLRRAAQRRAVVRRTAAPSVAAPARRARVSRNHLRN